MNRAARAVLRSALALSLVSPLALNAGPVAGAATAPAWFDDPTEASLTLVGTPGGARYEDEHGREVVLRGFNVSGEVKLAENGHLPFADAEDARESAAALRRSTGANAVRFLLSWERIQPAPDRIDHEYLRQVTEQMAAFLDQGFWVLPDYHQDLYSKHLFNEDSWYTGDGAPEWVVEAGDYPRESCGICVHWGQNMMSNEAVKRAKADFWHNRVLQTSAGEIGVQDAYLTQARATLRYFAEHLSDEQAARVIGFDPMNEPSAGIYEDGQDGAEWERDLAWPFFQKFRAVMDETGWQDKPAYVEPTVFWNNNVPFVEEPGGFRELGSLGTRYVFNAHFYHALAQSGLYGKAEDGENAAEFNEIRDRARELETAPFVSEFGHPLGGPTADKFPTVVKAMYQGMDSRLDGAEWWRNAARSGSVLSGTQWQWDIYHGRHHELMNDNPGEMRTEADGWNGEDFSLVRRDETGELVLRADPRVIDRIYPEAVDGTTVAFTYEDRSRDGDETLTWNEIPESMPNVRAAVRDGQYGVLAWRDGESAAPTELQLPETFGAENTTVISDLGIENGLPGYEPDGRTTTTPVAFDHHAGADRLLLTAPQDAGTMHYALVTNGSRGVDPGVLEAARAELETWAEQVDQQHPAGR